MDTLKNKKYITSDYISRYQTTPEYQDILFGRQLSGIADYILSSTQYISHKVKMDDTFDSLALKYYNNPTYWWIIAQFNKVTDPFVQLIDKYRIIKIPTITTIKFNREN